MKAALFLQVERTEGTIHETVAKGGDWVRQLIHATDVLYDFVHVPVPRRQLCFPEHGFFLIPMIGARPIMAMPLDPSFFVMAVRKPSSEHVEQVLKLRDMGDLISGMTVGLDPCRRVVVPGDLYGKNDAALARKLKACREMAKAWVIRSEEANAEIREAQNR